jgi:hypothetical protein
MAEQRVGRGTFAAPGLRTRGSIALLFIAAILSIGGYPPVDAKTIKDTISELSFPHDGNGFAERTGWAGSDDGLLVLDRNSDGIINNGTELFVQATVPYVFPTQTNYS